MSGSPKSEVPPVLLQEVSHDAILFYVSVLRARYVGFPGSTSSALAMYLSCMKSTLKVFRQGTRGEKLFFSVTILPDGALKGLLLFMQICMERCQVGKTHLERNTIVGGYMNHSAELLKARTIFLQVMTIPHLIYNNVQKICTIYIYIYIM